MRLGDLRQAGIEVVPTGALSLDVALGVGGLPRGRIIEIYGPESSGKTTLAAARRCRSAEEGRHCGNRSTQSTPWTLTMPELSA